MDYLRKPIDPNEQEQVRKLFGKRRSEETAHSNFHGLSQALKSGEKERSAIRVGEAFEEDKTG
ncbi:MAG: hypothetical protein OEY56_06560 [Cyclobacteriaceae bacterium]|nr:hypothetical protein [Cyclobacteriaceae bacterium]